MGKPSVDEQKPTAQEIAQFDIAKGKWDNYQQNGVPLQNEYMQALTADKLNADGSVRTDAGRAIARAQQQWSPMLTRGVNPNTGRGRTGMIPMLQDKMASDANIETGTRFAQQGGYLQGLQDVAAMGRGQVAGTLSAQQGLAGQAAAQARADARDSFQDRLGNQQALGNLTGTLETYGLSQVNPIAADGSYINGAYDNALSGFLGGLGQAQPAPITQGGQSYLLNSVKPQGSYAGLLGGF